MYSRLCATSVALLAAQIGIVGTEDLENSKKLLQEDAAVVERKRFLSRQMEIVNHAEQILGSITGWLSPLCSLTGSPRGWYRTPFCLGKLSRNVDLRPTGGSKVFCQF